MRLMIVSIIAFSLAALAMLVADGRITRALGIASLWGGDAKQVYFSSQNWQPKQSDHLISIPVPQGRAKTMVGFPSYASLNFFLPKYTNIIAGRLILEFSLQIPRTGGGSFRILINNDKRADLLFDPDEKKYRVIVDLTDSDIEENLLTISFSADGYGAEGECPDDRARISVIEFKPNSRLELNIDSPIYHPADAALLAGNPVRIQLPEDDNQQAREQLLTLIQKLSSHGIAVQLMNKRDSKGLITVRIDKSITEPRFDAGKLEIVISSQKNFNLFLKNNFHENYGLTRAKKKQAHVSLNTLGLTDSVRQFKHNIKWRTNYSLNNMPDGHAPQKLYFDIFTSIASDISDGLLTVTHNDSLIYSHPITASEANKGKQFFISLQNSKLENSIDIHLYTNENRIGVCNPGREGFAQIAERSHITNFKPAPTNSVEGIPSHLLSAGSLQFRAPYTLEESIYTKTIKSLKPIIPSTIDFITSKQKPTGAILTIIPSRFLKTEISQHLSEVLDSNHLGKQSAYPVKIWVSSNQIMSHEKNNGSIFEPLTRSLANRMIREQHIEPIIILQFPDTKKEQISG